METELTGRHKHDLGVILSDDLKVSYQVESAAARANSKLGRLKKIFSRGLFLWKVLYKKYIRPELKFAFQAWSPHNEKDIAIL